MIPEVFFVKYAFPCSFVLRQQKKITQEDFVTLEDAALHQKVLNKVFLERVFVKAFERISVLAEEMNKNKWDLDVLREYFLVRHNEIIEGGQSTYANTPPVLNELCMVHKAKVIGKKDSVLIVEYGFGKKRPVNNDLVPNAKVGNTVTIHYGYAVEIV